MTRIELVQRLSVEAGIGAGPASCLYQTGEYLRVVNWIDMALEEIQNAHPNWDFLLTDFSGTATPPITSPSDLGTWKTDGFRYYLTADGIAAEQFLPYIPWEAFRDTYLMGASRAQTGVPAVVTVKPDSTLLVAPIPDAAYTIVGEYYSLPKTMTLDTSVPPFPQFHMAIVWKALAYYGSLYSEPDKEVFGRSQFKPLMKKLELSQLPKMSWGPSLV